MFTLVIYDISDDELRAKVAQACKRFGLVRVQRSAFSGRISSSLRKELIAVLSKMVEEGEDNIQVYVVCEPDYTLRVELGKPFKGEESEMLV